MSNDITAAVISQHKTPFGYKMIIPSDTTSLFAAEDESEAHYLCALINSPLVREFIRTFSSAGRGFGAPSVMKHLAIPQYDPKDKTHIRLSEFSRELHRLKEKRDDRELSNLEKELETAVCRFFGVETA